MTYKINNKSIYNNLSFSFFSILFGIICHLLVLMNIVNFIDLTSIWLFILLLIILVPLLLLDYLINTTKGEIQIASDRLLIKDRGNEKQFRKEEIKKVTIYAAPSWNRKSTMRLLPFEDFHYVAINLKDKDTIYITSLSDHNLYTNIKKEELFTGLIYLHKKGLTGNGSTINSIFWNKLD